MSVVKDMVSLIRESDKRTTKPYDTVATVTRVEGSTVWVHIPGGVDETPVKKTIDAKAGQAVQVRVSGGSAFLIGNASAPPTDDTQALIATEIGETAQKDAKTARNAATKAAEDAAVARTAAAEAQAVAEATEQHFWHRSTDEPGDGAGTGAFVTDEAQDDFLDAMAHDVQPTTSRPLHNLLMNAEGILLRAAKRIRAAFTPSGVAFYDGEGNAASNVVAAFGSDGAQIGNTSDTHLEMDYHSMELIDRAGNTYFHVSDLRSNHPASDEYGEGFYAVITDTYTGDGSKTGFSLSNTSYIVNYKVYVDGAEESNVTKTETWFSFATAPADGSIVTATYPTVDQNVKAYTAGVRRNGENIGSMSFAEGYATTASGRYAHAEGRNTTANGYTSHAEGSSSTASGNHSHAEGYQTTASGFASHTEGRENEASGPYSHAEGSGNVASGGISHAEGSGNTASGECSHAEGYQTTASGNYAHSEGSESTASGNYSHAQGIGPIASGTASHAEGEDTTASGFRSHAQNRGTIAAYDSQTAIGKYNSNKSTTAFEIGNGRSASARSNAFTVDWSGNVEAAGTIKSGGTEVALVGHTHGLNFTNILSVKSLTTSVQNFSCAWNDYDALLICAVFYLNVQETILVPKSYFNTTSSGRRVILYDAVGGYKYYVYQNGNSQISIACDKASGANYGVHIYGIKIGG